MNKIFNRNWEEIQSMQRKEIPIPKEYHMFVKSKSDKKLQGLKVHFITSDINEAKANIKYIKSKKWKSALTYDEYHGVYNVWTDHSFVPVDYIPKSVVESGRF